MQCQAEPNWKSRNKDSLFFRSLSSLEGLYLSSRWIFWNAPNEPNVSSNVTSDLSLPWEIWVSTLNGCSIRIWPWKTPNFNYMLNCTPLLTSCFILYTPSVVSVMSEISIDTQMKECKNLSSDLCNVLYTLSFRNHSHSPPPTIDAVQKTCHPGGKWPTETQHLWFWIFPL